MKTEKLVMLAVLALSTLTMNAQGVEFMPEGSLLKDALAKAKAENKDVLLDCYTVWCGPCRMMTTSVFPLKEMGDYINPKYVAIKIDMEKGEGPEIARRHDVAAYPTFIVFDADGKEKGRIVGGAMAERFISELEKRQAANDNMDERYAQGERSKEFLMQYMDYLGSAYRNGQLAEVAAVLLDSQAETFAADSALVDVFMQYMSDPYSTAFVYTVLHPEAMKAAVGDRKYEAKVDQVFTLASGKTVKRNEAGGGDLDTEALDKLCAQAESMGLDSGKYRFNAMLGYVQYNKDWNGFVELTKAYLTNNEDKVSDGRLGGWAKRVAMSTQDTQPRASMKAMLDARILDLKSGKRKIQTTPDDPDGSALMKQLEVLSAELAKPTD